MQEFERPFSFTDVQFELDLRARQHQHAHATTFKRRFRDDTQVIPKAYLPLRTVLAGLS